MEQGDDSETATSLNQPAQLPEYALPPARIWPQYVAASAAALGIFASFAAGISPFLYDQIETEFGDSVDIRWFFLTRCLGAVAGAQLLGLVAHWCGRKWIAVLIQLLVILAMIMTQITHDIPCIILASFISGMGGGGAFAIIPMYVTEIADDVHRGVLGILIVAMGYTGSYMFHYLTRFVTEYWVLMVICTLPSVLAVGAAILMPETPPFLISKGRQNEAAKVLRFLRGDSRQEWERQNLESSFTENASILKPFMISLGLMTLQSLSDVGYPTMAAERGLTITIGGNYQPFILLLLNAVSLIGAAVAVYFIKWRLLLLISCIGTTVGSFVVCLSYLVIHVPVIYMLGGLLSIASFIVAKGHLPYIVMMQLLPRKTNAITCSLITSFYLFLQFLHMYIVYFHAKYEHDMIFTTVVSALCTIYVFLFVPELKRKPVRIIQDELSHKSFIMLTL